MTDWEPQGTVCTPSRHNSKPSLSLQKACHATECNDILQACFFSCRCLPVCTSAACKFLLYLMQHCITDYMITYAAYSVLPLQWPQHLVDPVPSIMTSYNYVIAANKSLAATVLSRVCSMACLQHCLLSGPKCLTDNHHMCLIVMQLQGCIKQDRDYLTSLSASSDNTQLPQYLPWRLQSE